MEPFSTVGIKERPILATLHPENRNGTMCQIPFKVYGHPGVILITVVDEPFPVDPHIKTLNRAYYVSVLNRVIHCRLLPVINLNPTGDFTPLVTLQPILIKGFHWCSSHYKFFSTIEKSDLRKQLNDEGWCVNEKDIDDLPTAAL